MPAGGQATGDTMLLSSLAFAVPLRVESGVYPLGEGEVWLGGFVIDDVVGDMQACRDRDLPTVEERRVAARLPGFVPSGVFEALAMPSTDACGYTTAVLEAEGIDGWLWFAGWAPHLGEAEVITGKGSALDGIVRVHANPWHFWGEESKPAPRGARCVTRDPVAPSARHAAPTALSVRAGRVATSPVTEEVAAGVAVTVWHQAGDFAFVEVPRQVIDRSGEGPETRTCTVRGWIPAGALAATPRTGPK